MFRIQTPYTLTHSQEAFLEILEHVSFRVAGILFVFQLPENHSLREYVTDFLGVCPQHLNAQSDLEFKPRHVSRVCAKFASIVPLCLTCICQSLLFILGNKS